MKIFISHPMSNRTKDEIKKEREKISNAIKAIYPDAEIINSFFEDAFVDEEPSTANMIRQLGRSISMMGEADLVVFWKGYNESRGCQVEQNVAYEYGLKHITIDEGYYRYSTPE